jgi:GT2 family glycosyltransferase
VKAPVDFDVIILSFAANDELRKVTERAIESLRVSESPDAVRFNVVVIESNRALVPFQYAGTTTLYPDGKFGYNRFLNIGIAATSGDFVCLANNDLVFREGWASAILSAAEERPDILSFSPVDPWLHDRYGLESMPKLVVGYEKMVHVTGWCLVVRRRIFDVIGKLDEKLEFWYVDDDYIRTLIAHDVVHALVRDSRVDHKSGETIRSDEVGEAQRKRLTRSQWLYFDFKWNHRSRLIYFVKRAAQPIRDVFARSSSRSDVRT